MNWDTSYPDSWIRYKEVLPLLQEVVSWQRLRQWGLSEVWRITTHTGKTWIAKQSRGTMAVELDKYHNLLIPLGILQPRIHSFWQNANDHCFIMEDLGIHTLEQQPAQEHFLESARVLARFRTRSIRLLLAGENCALQRYTLEPAHFLETRTYIVQHPQPGQQLRQEIKEATSTLARHLHTLYRHHPPTLSHNDYHVKNIVLHNDTVVPVDWTMANIHPHHGDLYTLLRGAMYRNVPREAVIAAYLAEEQRYLATARAGEARPLEWQIALGGVCLLLVSIRWILDEAQYHLPGSVQWIPRMGQNIIENMHIVEAA